MDAHDVAHIRGTEAAIRLPEVVRIRLPGAAPSRVLVAWCSHRVEDWSKRGLLDRAANRGVEADGDRISHASVERQLGQARRGRRLVVESQDSRQGKGASGPKRR